MLTCASCIARVKLESLSFKINQKSPHSASLIGGASCDAMIYKDKMMWCLYAALHPSSTRVAWPPSKMIVIKGQIHRLTFDKSKALLLSGCV